jgi:hypothetical protein
MPTKKMPVKDPRAILDYVVNLSAELGADSLATVTWSIDPGIVKSSDSVTTKAATVWLDGGTDGQTYKVTLFYVTLGGRQDTRSFLVPVRNRG